MSARYDEIEKLMFMKNIIDGVEFKHNLGFLERELRISFNPSFIARSLETCKLEEIMQIDKITVVFPKDFTLIKQYRTQIVQSGWKIE